MLRWLSIPTVWSLLVLTHQYALARPPENAPIRQNQIRAKTLFLEGKAAYSAGKYEQAANAFTAGYRLDPQPAFLINIAQSHRAAGDIKQALRYYRQFLSAEPHSSLRSQVLDIIEELQATPAAPAPVAAPPAGAPPPAVVSPSPSAPVVSGVDLPPPSSSGVVAPSTSGAPPPAASPIYKRWWFWTAIAVSVGAAVGVATYASQREPDYVKEGGLGAVRW